MKSAFWLMAIAASASANNNNNQFRTLRLAQRRLQTVPGACEECVQQFAQNGGCEAMRNGGDVPALIPEGCYACGDAAHHFCGGNTTGHENPCGENPYDCCPEEMASCDADTECKDLLIAVVNEGEMDFGQLLENPNANAVFVCMNEKDRTPCTEELVACMEEPECKGIMRSDKPPTSAAMNNAAFREFMACGMEADGAPCVAETVACFANEACAVSMGMVPPPERQPTHADCSPFMCGGAFPELDARMTTFFAVECCDFEGCGQCEAGTLVDGQCQCADEPVVRTLSEEEGNGNGVDTNTGFPGDLPTDCGLAHVDCTKGGNTGAYCVYSHHCACTDDYMCSYAYGTKGIVSSECYYSSDEETAASEAYCVPVKGDAGEEEARTGGEGGNRNAESDALMQCLMEHDGHDGDGPPECIWGCLRALGGEDGEPSCEQIAGCDTSSCTEEDRGRIIAFVESGCDDDKPERPDDKPERPRDGPFGSCLTKEKWSEEKTAWCCEHEQRGCPESKPSCGDMKKAKTCRRAAADLGCVWDKKARACAIASGCAKYPSKKDRKTCERCLDYSPEDCSGMKKKKAKKCEKGNAKMAKKCSRIGNM